MCQDTLSVVGELSTVQCVLLVYTNRLEMIKYY